MFSNTADMVHGAYILLLTARNCVYKQVICDKKRKIFFLFGKHDHLLVYFLRKPPSYWGKHCIYGPHQTHMEAVGVGGKAHSVQAQDWD